jgi:hypothetical protein
MDFTQSPFLCFTALIAAVGCISSLLRVFFQSGRKPASLPPGKQTPSVQTIFEISTNANDLGPPTVPLFGNELQIPKTDAHFQYARFSLHLLCY